MLKRLFDILASVFGLLFLLPFLLVFMLLVWLQDFDNPFYIAPRARDRHRTFQMFKLRSMIRNADKIGGASTSSNDRRITWVGKLIRKAKFDEVPQLWNVLIGDMSLVGPRPQVMRDVANFYTNEEFRLFDTRPGITDFSSIVFADEGDILKDSSSPDLKYNQIIRPWKSRLGLFYTQHRSVWVDIQLILLTVLSAFSREQALRGVCKILTRLKASPELIVVARRTQPLLASPPPGATEIENRS